MDRLINTFSTENAEVRATFLIVLSAILYGFLGFFGASLMKLNFPISSMLCWRFGIASICMGITLIGSKHKWKRITSNSWLPYLYIILSSICYTTACSFYFMASSLIGTGIAMVIYFAYPLFVIILVMLKGKQWVDKNTLVSLLITLLGLLFLKGSHQGAVSSHWGILYALISAFFFAAYVMISKQISNYLPSNVNTFILCVTNTLIFLIYALIHHSFVIPNQFNMWALAIGLGIIATALPIQLMLEGLKTISASKASILSALEPSVTLFVGMLLLSEQVSHLQMLGALLILFSAAYIQFSRE